MVLPPGRSGANQEPRTDGEWRGLGLLAAGVLGAVFTLFTLGALGVPDPITGVLASVAAGLPTAADQALRAARPEHGFTRHGRPRMPAAAVAAFTTTGLFGLHVLLDFVFVGMGFALYVQGGDFDLDPGAVQLGYTLAAAFALWAATFLLLRAVVRRWHPFEHWWAVTSAALSGLLQLAWVLSSDHTLRTGLVTVGVLSLVGQLGVALAAAEAGRRDRFVRDVARRVTRLPEVDQHVLVDLLAESPPAAGRPSFGSSLGGVGVGVILTLTTFMVLLGAGVPEQVTSVIAGAAGLVPAALSSALQRSTEPRDAELRALASGRPIRPGATVFTLTLQIFILRALLLGLFWYTTIGWVLLVEIDPALGLMLYRLLHIAMEVPAFLLLGFMLLCSSAQRLGQHALPWLLTAVTLAGLLNLALTAANANRPDELPTALLTWAVLAALTVPAARRGRRTAPALALGRLLGRLPASEALAVAELIEQSGPEDRHNR